MKIEFEKVEAFKVKGKTREFVFMLVSTWNTLLEWRATTGETLVLGPASVIGGFRGPFSEIFDTWAGRPVKGESVVVMATPELIEELALSKPEPESKSSGAPESATPEQEKAK